MMFAAAALGIIIAMALVLFRAFAGPTVFDRILAVNTVGTLTIVLISVYGFLSGRPEFLDIALLYGLINFIGTVAVTKLVQFQGLGHPLGDHEDGDV